MLGAATTGGQRPQHWAAKAGHAGCVRVLLSAEGLEVNAENRSGESAIVLAEAIVQVSTFPPGSMWAPGTSTAAEGARPAHPTGHEAYVPGQYSMVRDAGR